MKEGFNLQATLWPSPLVQSACLQESSSSSFRVSRPVEATQASISCMPSDNPHSSGYAERVYSRYSEVRPGRTAPGRASDLLALGEPVFRKLYLSHVPANKD